MNEIKDFYNPGALGDIIYCLPFCLSVSGIYSKYQLNNGNKFNFISDGRAFIKSHQNQRYECLLSMKKLLQTQPYFNNIDMRKENVNNNEKQNMIDCGMFRNQWVYMKQKDIIKRYYYLYRTLKHYNSQQPWIILEKNAKYDYFKNKIVIFRSPRYRNNNIKNYDILKPFKNKIVYIGISEEEYKSMNINCEFYKINDFLQIAYILNTCRFCIGNQTSFFAVAEALKIPRLLESSSQTPDVMPTGGIANDFINMEDFQNNLNLYMNYFY